MELGSIEPHACPHTLHLLLFAGVEMGLGLSIGISLLLVIFESAYPHTAVLGRLPGTHHYRNIKQYQNAEQYDGIVLIRCDAPIYFANTQHIRDKIQKYYQRAKEQLHEDHQSQVNQGTSSNDVPLSNEVQHVQFVVLELTPVSHIDTSALHTIHEMKNSLLEDNVQLCLSNPNPRVMKRLVQSGLADEIGRDHIFVALHDAVHYCLNHMDNVEITKRLSRISLNKMEVQNGSNNLETNTDNVQVFWKEDDVNVQPPAENSDGAIGLNV